MKFDKLLVMLGDHGYFDLASVIQLSGESRESIRMQLYRWCKAGKLLPLRRGMYAFSKIFGKTILNPLELANNLYKPSYISLHWALGYYGLIPEKVVTYTSITSRQPKKFENSFGFFRYQNIKSEAFFGYTALDFDGEKVLIAEPEKALLDFWYLETGKWCFARMAEMRFQNFEMVDIEKLQKYAERFSSHRLIAIVQLWIELAGKEQEGEFIL